jgi:predicted permease
MAYLFWLGVVLIFVYEFYALEQHKGETISEVIWRITVTHPLIALAFGVLMGHFFWQSASVYSGACK